MSQYLNLQTGSGNNSIQGNHNIFNQIIQKESFDLVGFIGSIITCVGSILPLFEVNMPFINLQFSIIEIATKGVSVGGFILPVEELKTFSIIFSFVLLTSLALWVVKLNRIASILSILNILCLSIYIFSIFSGASGFFQPFKIGIGAIIIFIGLVIQIFPMIKGSNILKSNKNV